jgi:sugar phosphate isomerase/epimerase
MHAGYLRVGTNALIDAHRRPREVALEQEIDAGGPLLLDLQLLTPHVQWAAELVGSDGAARIHRQTPSARWCSTLSPAIHLGVNTCFAVKRWPEPPEWARLCVDELGVDRCQVSLDLIDPALDRRATSEYADAVRHAAARSGLQLHSTFTGLAGYSSSQLLHPSPRLRTAARRWFERAVDLTARMGVAGTGGFVGAFSVQDAGDASRRRALLIGYRDALRRLADHAAGRGLEFLLFENMAVPREFGHCIEEAHEIEAMTAGTAVPWRLCLDVGHPCALHTGTRSDDPLAWLAERWEQVPVVQVQQANRDGDFHWPFTDARNTVGLVDASEVVAALRRWDADDIEVFLEVIHPFEADDAQVLDDLRASVEHWSAAIARA